MAEFVKFKNAAGGTVFINPSLVQSVRTKVSPAMLNDDATEIVLSNDLIYVVIGKQEEIVKQLEETYEGLFYKVAYETNFFNR